MPYSKTSVPVERSQSQLRKLLTTYGAQQFAFGEEISPPRAILQFAHTGLMVQMRVTLKPAPPGLTELQQTAHDEQEARRIWRVIHWNVKARLEAVDEGIETFAQAFLPHLLNPRTGQTVYEDLSSTGRLDLGEPLPQLPR